jgi:predicted ATPase/Tfp pilus assembly protein PilF
MGQVYRALDMRLKREVALKTLPEAWANDPHYIKRLELEAQAASSLNHPHIVTIYELGVEPPYHYIVMELVEGANLRAIIESGGLPVDRLLGLAAQVTDALAAAHSKGIVHRDLKPENVVVTKEGRVKVLDFGLARIEPHLLEAGSGEEETAAGPLTAAGTVVGTAAYMSPEQVQGHVVDFRSDQFSLGVMLYEMATGHRPFEQRTAAATIAAMLRDPPPSLDGSALPPPLQWLIARCLAKDPGERYASTREIATALAGLLEQLEAPGGGKLAASFSAPPSTHTSFVGRESEQAAIRALLQAPDVRLVTLTGPGGTGKTRLAIRVAEETRAEFGGGVCFVSLAGLADSARVVPEIAAGFGMRAAAGPQGALALGETLSRALREPTLLVLDSFERVVDAAPEITTLQGRVPRLKVLVTSQAALRLYGERELAVAPLGVPDTARLPALAELRQSPAVALFVERAAAAQPGFALTAENAQAVAAVCSRLDGLPLAIELAAARVKLLSPAALAARLERSLDFLTGPRDLPARQQTLRATIDWSHELLSPPEQALFRRLAVFSGGCTLEGAEAVADARHDLGVDVLEAMSSLVDKSLLRCRDATAADPRFDMLEIVREYALERFVKSGDQEVTRRAHAAYALVLAEDGAQAISGGSDAAETLARFDQELPNLRAALDFLIADRQGEWATRLATGLLPYWRRRERLSEGRDRLTAVLALPGVSDKARAGALYAASLMIGEQGDGARTRPLLEESVALYRKLGDARAALVAQNSLAVACQLMGDLQAARTHLEQVLQEARERGDASNLAHALNNLGSVTHASGNPREAVQLYEQCREEFEKQGDRMGAAWALDQQADAARDAGDLASARELYERSLRIFRELDHGGGVATAITDLARLARRQGDLATARRHCDEVLALGPFGSDRAAARLLEELGALAAADREPRRALVLFGAAAALRIRLGWPVPASERAGSERLTAEQKDALGNAAASAWSEGWRMDTAEALRFARESRPAAV